MDNSGEQNKSCSFNALLRLILLESVIYKISLRIRKGNNVWFKGGFLCSTLCNPASFKIQVN